MADDDVHTAKPTKRRVVRWVAGSLLGAFGTTVIAASLGQLLEQGDPFDVLLDRAAAALLIGLATSVLLLIVVLLASLFTQKGARRETWLWLAFVGIAPGTIGFSTAIAHLLTAGLVAAIGALGSAVVTLLGTGLLALGGFMTRDRLQALIAFFRISRERSEREVQPDASGGAES